jgi:hypothetical protein
MKRLTVLFAAILLMSNLYSQQQIVNSDFEDWILFEGSSGYPDYENPSPEGTWATANKSAHLTLGITPMTTKTTDCVSGNYAMQMTTQEVFNLPAAGSCWIGTFDISGFTPITTFGVPYTDKPNYFRGYYKYIPVEGDSCYFYALLSKWNGSSRDTIAFADFQSTAIVSSYEAFSLAFDYHSEDTPDTITIVFTSSAGGESYQGQVGSTLFIDKISLSLTSNIQTIKQNTFNVSPNPTNGLIKINSNNEGETHYSILNESGQEVKSGTINSKLDYIDLIDVSEGIYFIKIQNETGIEVKKIIKN